MPEPATAAPPGDIVFSAFRLDRRGGQLTQAGTPVPLRPKTWAVLVYLAERPGVLVSKEELLDAVWPDVAVTPDTLTKSIGELRAVLSDDARAPRFIETVHRRGFRFIDRPAPPAARDPSTPGWDDAQYGRRPVVGRSAELQQLARHFAKARGGDRQMLFITGQAGVGKTTLVDAFLDSRPLRESPTPVWVARGECIEMHGPREAYMPVLKALDRLARRPDAAPLIELLRHTAPTWLAQMPWLIGDDGAALQRAVQAARAERMLREYAALIEALTSTVTLVLVLEDLHWSDPSTADLLALLANRRERAQLLLIGTYRPAEAAIHDHPLGRTVRSLLAGRQCAELPLHDLSRADVEHYLAARFPGALPPPTMAAHLHAHTDGNPLFLRAVVDHMQARGWILDTAPGWSFAALPPTFELGVPDDARRMIALQLDALSPADRRLLAAASVAGHDTPARILAAALGGALDEVEERCEALARPQRFLRCAGSRDWPDGSSALCYTFTHELYRQVVYDDLPPGTRQRLHQRVAEALEAACGEGAAEIASELAGHFSRSGDTRRALRCLVAAADSSQQRGAGREAIEHLQEAIALSARLGSDDERKRQELALRMQLAPLLSDHFGFASVELGQSCERTEALCAQIGSATQRFESLYALVHVHAVRADPTTLPALLDRLAALARDIGAPEYGLLSDSLRLRCFMHDGRFREATELGDGPLAAWLAQRISGQPLRYGADAIVATAGHHAHALWFLGYAERADAMVRDNLDATARPGVSPFTRCVALGHLTVHAGLRGDAREARPIAQRLLALSGEHGFPLWAAMGLAVHGWALAATGDVQAGIGELERAWEAHQASGARIFSTHIQAFLAEAHLRAGATAAGLEAVQAGLQIAATTLDRSFVPELWRLKGELLLAGAAGQGAAPSAWPAAERCLRQALEEAQRGAARSLELRAATSLARAWQSQQRNADAQALLEGVCASFPVDATSPDLAAARAQLACRPATPTRSAAGRSAAARPRPRRR